MKRYLPLLFALTAFAFTGEDLTQNIKEAKIRIDLPNASWSLSDKRSEGDMSVYIFKREPVIDADGRQIIPNIAVIVDEVEYTDQGGLDHTIYVVHGINGTKGFQLICDVTTNIHDKVVDEFFHTLKSVRK